ncbi:unnamed protein product [Phytophthora fragariaefolia]|uniref:Unnamed protein product n=1 Tax=Phytophthora fragariaefolia TaxID=1490495 RepID=A0A9W6YAT8_9STRA|nr:unnamed protein product [Phytophthora fragariaefolia]
MGKNKLKQQLKRQQRQVLATQSTGAEHDADEGSRVKKKRKTAQDAAEQETEVEIDALAFDDAFSAGLAFEQLESYDGALAAFQRAVQCRPSHLGALTHLADVYAADGQPEEALKCYVTASELEGGKEDASVWFRLGLARAALEQQKEATEAYRKSMEINVGALEAVEDAQGEEAVELSKAYGVTLAALAEAFGEMGDLNGAVKVFEDAAAKFPAMANVHYNLANMRMARSGSAGDNAFDPEVARCLENAIKLSPDTCDFVEDLAVYLEQHGQQPDRVRELKAKAEELNSAEAATEEKQESSEGKESDSDDEDEEEESQDEEKEED